MIFWKNRYISLHTFTHRLIHFLFPCLQNTITKPTPPSPKSTIQTLTRNHTTVTILFFFFFFPSVSMASKLAFNLTSPRVFTAPIQKPIISSSSSLSSPSCSIRVQFDGKQSTLRGRMLLLPTKATADQQAGLCYLLSEPCLLLLNFDNYLSFVWSQWFVCLFY